MKKFQREMLAYAKSIGIDDAQIEHGGRHPRIVGRVKGKPFVRIIAGTLSDNYRGLRQARCDLRREARRLSQP